MSDLEDQLEDDIEDEDVGNDDAEDRSQPDKKRRKRNMFIDDDAEEASDDDAGAGGGGRKEKRRKGNQFIDDIADVEDDDEDDVEDEDDDPHRFIDEGEDDGKVADVNYKLDAMRRRERMREENDEEMQKMIERYEQQPAYEGDGGEDEAVNQHSLLPSWNDPTKLWLVKCQDRQERQCVTQLMQKFVNMQLKGEKLPIKAAFCLDSLSGWFYVEAEKESGVRDAINGLRVVMRSKQPQLVPVEEMTDAITVKSTARSDLKIGSWVRVQSGAYKGDLALLEDLDPAGTRIVIKVVPRVDYAEMIKRKQDREQGIKAPPFGGKKKGAVRVPAAPFNKQEAEANGQQVEERYGSSKQMLYILNGSRQFQDGYELKVVTHRAIRPEPSPPFEEMQRFMNAAVGGAGVDDAALLATGSKNKTVFSKGDKIMVKTGDLANMKGEVVEVMDTGIVWVKPDIVGFNEKLEFEPTDLQKHIEIGTHVKVVAGAHHVGELGMVNLVEGGVAMVLLDSTNKEIRVLVNNLTETLDTNSGLESFGQYSLHQAVLLTDNTVGMIINISPETCSVLTNSGAAKAPVRQCRLQDIKRGLETRRLPAADCNNSRISVEAMVEVVEGPFRGKVGTVQHVFKVHVWLRCRDVTQNGGFIVVFAKQTRLRGSGKPASSGMGGSMPPRTPGRFNPASPAYGALRSPAHPSMGSHNAGLQSPRHGEHSENGYGGGRGGGRGDYGGRGGYGGGRGRGGQVEDSLVNQRVKIVTGGYRGYRGLVQHATNTHVRMELDATNKVVTLERSRVRLDDARVLQQRTAVPHFGSNMPPPTPHRGFMHDADMPAATPGFAADTPAYMAAGTPGAAYTPGTNMHAMTPAMTPGTAAAPTPSMTPGTMAMSPAMDAPTPYGAAAATPGTVGLGGAMTPGFGMTPGGMTPGATPAATPGDAWSPGYGEGDADDSLFHHWTGLHVSFGDDEQGLVTSYNAETGEFTIVRGERDEQGALQQSDVHVTMPVDRVTLVVPSKKDKVKIVAGDTQNIGQVGELIGIDNEDGIVKTERGDIAILLLRDIGRLEIK